MNSCRKNGNSLHLQVKYARSEIHLSELVDSVCEEFENYVQAREKTGDKAVTIIRITTKSGGMNPLFGSVDIVPDEDLNKRLKFYVRKNKGCADSDSRSDSSALTVH